MPTFNTDIFSVYDKQWALLAAGAPDNYNTMTISWGGMGTLWGKPVVTVYVKPVRYTHKFMDDNEYFTVSFFPEQYRDDLMILGSKSGRDGDKVALTALTATKAGESTTFEQAEVTLLCKKIYRQDLVRDTMPENVVKTFYTSEEPHTMFIGEVVEIIHNS
ncbi:MAG: flavin reductase [Eubacterium sp.]|nr:flavin reductase [Eubacterium sp.]